MNVFNTDKSRLSSHELAMASNTIIRQKYHKDFTLEFSRDRKSMSAFVTTSGQGAANNQQKTKMFVKGAPESIIERCTHVRVGTQKVTMKLIHQYGTGRDTLRCLALGTIDNPPRKEDMNLEDARKFVNYEVSIRYKNIRREK
jgi:Ca2+ transporting ATPase